MFRILSTWFMDNPLESVFIVLKNVHFFTGNIIFSSRFISGGKVLS